MKTKKLIYSLVFACVLGLSACADKKNKGEKLTEDNVTLWGCAATEKVLQDRAMENYQAIMTEPSVEILMARGEYEAGQIIITPNVDVPNYNVTVSDLTLTGGDAKISKDNIYLYKEKYITVNVNFQNNGAPIGEYPDALLPFEAAVRYEENNIKKGENQGIYVSVETALDQTPGIYTGNITFDFKEFIKTVPISVEVVGVTVSEENHVRSSFLMNWTFEHGELNATQAMYDAYADALIKYRIMPNNLFLENKFSDENIARYTEKAYTYMQNPRVSNLGIPYKNGSYTYNGKSHQSFDVEIFEKYLRSYAEKSFETGFNMFAKSTFYNTVIDEPVMNGYGERVNANCLAFNTTITKIANELEADESIVCEKKAEIIQSLRKIPHIVTNNYVGTWADRTGEEYVNTFCPMIDSCDTEEQRAKYDVQDEKWWYVANVPLHPFPNYQMDHNTTLNVRSIGWMQAEYGFVGMLYWGVNYYQTTDPITDTGICLEDYYGGNSKRTHHKSTAEGYLFYPGGQYGLSEPVGSLRLEAIRDGYEEYELIRSLEEKYKELGFSADELMQSMNSVIYSGTRVSTDSDKFYQARKTLLELCAAATSPAEMCIIGSEDNGTGKVVSKIYMNEGYELKQNGETVTNSVPHGNGRIYMVEQTLDQATNYLKLSFTADGVNYAYEQNLGGAVHRLDLNKVKDQISGDLATATAALVSGSEIGLSGDVLKVDLGATTTSSQRVKFNVMKLATIDANTRKIVIGIYNPEDTDLEFTVYAKFDKSRTNTQQASATLKAKELTTVTIDVGSVSWAKAGNLQHLLFKFGSTSEEAARSVYVEKMSVYNK